MPPTPPNELEPPAAEQVDIPATCRALLTQIAPDGSALERVFHEVEHDLELAGRKMAHVMTGETGSLWDRLWSALGDDK